MVFSERKMKNKWSSAYADLVRLMKETMVFFAVFTFSPFSLQAEVNVKASVDRNQLVVGETFTLQVSLSSDQSVKADTPPLPNIKKVKGLHSWISHQSKSSVFNTGKKVDFKTLHTTHYNFQYEAGEEGQVLINPIEVRVKNKPHFTGKIVVNVLPIRKRAKKSKRPSNSLGGFQFSNPGDVFEQLEEHFNSFFKSPLGKSKPFGSFPDPFNDGPRSPEDAFFIVARTDKKEVFKGEQLLVSWFLYTQGRVRDIDTLKYPTLKGFWKEDIHLTTHLQYEREMIEGVPYNRALLASYALFPIEEGPAIIDSYRAKVTISGFNLRNFQTTKGSKKIPILIKPLPTEGRSSHFSGGVGKFQMIVETSGKSIVTHQPFSLKVRFEGQGNAKFIELPKLPIGSDLEIYDIKNESRFFKNGQSFKDFEILLIPRQAGEIVIGELRTSYFDPEKREYVSINSKPIRLTVLQGIKQGSIGEERLKSKVKKKALPGIAMEWNPDFEPGSSYLFIWIFVGILGLMVLLTKWAIDLGLFVKKVSLDDIIQRRFNRMEIFLAQSRWKDLGVEATNTVYLVTGHIAGQRGAGEEIEGVLAKIAPSVRREIEEPLRKLMDFFGLLGFGPKSFIAGFRDSKQVAVKLGELKRLLLRASQLMKGLDESDKDKTL